jgi:Uma2 family endonuclease
MTIEEFLTWQAQQARKFEFVDGHPVGMAGAKLRHDRVTGNAFTEIRRQLRAAGSPCDAFTSDIGIRTAASRIRRPEVSVLCPPFDEDATISDRPRLIVEVLSESPLLKSIFRRCAVRGMVSCRSSVSGLGKAIGLPLSR